MNSNPMNHRNCRVGAAPLNRWLGFLVLMAILASSLRANDSENPSAVIESIRAVGTELVVTVLVPPGKRRITLEARSRLVRGAWTPQIVRWSDAKESTQLTVTLPTKNRMEMLRIRDETEAEVGLPSQFFGGATTFAPLRLPEGALNREFAGDPTLFNPMALDSTVAAGVNVGASRAVVESDIWKLDGDTLYFFNQQRGLQVFDLSDPDRPILTGSLPLAVSGEQMYRLPTATADGSVWLALLTQQGCNYQASEILLVNVKSGRPMLASRLQVRGQIKETRLVGEALYLATYDWFQPPPREVRDANGNITGQEHLPWESRTIISSFDLADPTLPVSQPSIELPVTPDAIAATDRYLYVATTGSRTPQDNERLVPWVIMGNHAVILFDLSDPRGTLTQVGYLLTAGRVADKFKLGQLGENAEALAVVSEIQGTGREITETQPDGTNVTRWEWIPPQAVVETFSLENPAAPTALSQLTLVTNESVFATRFAGDRAYVVTFRRVDPLWILDLSNPAQPAIRGELEIPGFSTFLQPLANNTRLLALGVEGGRTIVQLFDVADASHPSLMSKVFLGEGWSWSEGNSDEKAFQVFPDAGLALVPWQGQRGGNNSGQWFQGIQLIDFNLSAGTLAARGVIDHALQARRATLLGEHIVSVSGQELLSVDATDRDHPRIVSELALTTPVDRVFVRGDQLLQVRDAGLSSARLALTSTHSSETSLAELALDPLPVIGADLRGDRLCLLQFRADGWSNEIVSVERQVVMSVSQPPLQAFRTNYFAVEFPPPLVRLEVTNILIRDESWSPEPSTTVTVQWREVPQPIATNMVTTVITRSAPPLPTGPSEGTYTLTWIRPEFTSAASTWTTNTVLTSYEIAQPPLLVTNLISENTSQLVRVPGDLRFSIVEVSEESLALASQLVLENPTNFYGSALTALWPDEQTVVWTELANRGFWGGGWLDVVRPTVGNSIVFSPWISDGDRIGNLQGISVDFWWGGWGYEERNFFAFDLSDSAEPMLASRTRLGGTGDGTNDWNGFSSAFVADGKVFIGHRISHYLPAPETSGLVTNWDGSVAQQILWQPGTWEHEHFLDVLDFADAGEPNVREPVQLPGSLKGISHHGRLVYVSGTDLGSTNEPAREQLHALAYDGVQASLVDSLPLPTIWPQPLLVRPDGGVILGLPPATTNDAPALEMWAVSTAGQFERYASVPLLAPAEELNMFEDLLVVTAGAQFLFFDATDAGALQELGSGERPCTVWFDWATADASAETGLWLPRGTYGLWHVDGAGN